MQRYLLLFMFIVPLLLHAGSAVVFSKAELEDIRERHGNKAVARIADFSNHLEAFKKLGRNQQLVRVNSFLNGYLPEYDAVINKREEYWSTPKEFLSVGYGDCEEYAIAKYFTLRELGFDGEKFCLAVVRDRYSGGYHMVLTYFKEPGKMPLVLDNLSFKILPLSQRSDLQFQYCFNEKGVFALDEKGERVALKQREMKFERLMKRIAEGR